MLFRHISTESLPLRQVAPFLFSNQISTRHSDVNPATTLNVQPGPMASSTSCRQARAPAANKHLRRFEVACEVEGLAGEMSVSNVLRLVKQTWSEVPRRSCRTRLTAKWTLKCKHQPYAMRAAQTTARDRYVLRRRACSIGKLAKLLPLTRSVGRWFCLAISL